MPLFEVVVNVAPRSVLVDAEDEVDARDKAELEVLKSGYEVDSCGDVVELGDSEVADTDELDDLDLDDASGFLDSLDDEDEDDIV